MKPLLMMRTKGLAGSMFAKHAGCSKLTKSSGAQVGLDIVALSVPDVVGLGDTIAAAIITAAGLQPAKIGTVDPVVSQNPEAGTNVAKGSTVTYTLTS